MSTLNESKSEQRRSALDYIENQVDIWNRTANNKKRVITIWRKRIAIAMLVGAALGLASEEVIDSKFAPLFSTSDGSFRIEQALAILSAISIALATYAGAKILSGELEKSQLKARSACEALKVQGYLYSMKAPPYSGKHAEKLLFKRVEIILKDVSNIPPDLSIYGNSDSWLSRFFSVFYMGKKSADEVDLWKQRFDENMTFDNYIKERVEGQVNDYYRVKASEFQATINKANAATLFFGFAGVAFGAVGATYIAGITMWVGLISTASASITSYIHANKYEYLLMSYISTASELELLAARYKSMEAPSIRMQQRFITETETIFSTEHNSWLSEIAGSSEDDRDILETEEGVQPSEIPEVISENPTLADESTESPAETDEPPNAAEL